MTLYNRLHRFAVAGVEGASAFFGGTELDDALRTIPIQVMITCRALMTLCSLRLRLKAGIIPLTSDIAQVPSACFAFVKHEAPTRCQPTCVSMPKSRGRPWPSSPALIHGVVTCTPFVHTTRGILHPSRLFSLCLALRQASLIGPAVKSQHGASRSITIQRERERERKRKRKREREREREGETGRVTDTQRARWRETLACAGQAWSEWHIQCKALCKANAWRLWWDVWQQMPTCSL